MVSFKKTIFLYKTRRTLTSFSNFIRYILFFLTASLIINNLYADEVKTQKNNNFEIINPDNLATLGKNPSEQKHLDPVKTAPNINPPIVPSTAAPNQAKSATQAAPSIPAPIKLAPTLAPPVKSKPVVPQKIPAPATPTLQIKLPSVAASTAIPLASDKPPIVSDKAKESSDKDIKNNSSENKRSVDLKDGLKKSEYNFTDWSGSLMFSPKAIDNLKKILDRMALTSDVVNSNSSNKRHKPDINSIFASAEKVDVAPSFYLPSILYRDKNEWVVWLNDKKFTADNTSQWTSLIPFFELVSVEKFYAVFKWRTHFLDHLSPNWRTKLIQDENGDYFSLEKDIFVNAEMNDIMFKLKPNQSFASFTMSIEEGRVAPTTVGPLPVEDDKSKQPDDKSMFDIMPK